MQDIVIDSIGAKGDGVAAGPVYAPLTLPGERVRAERQGDRAEAARHPRAQPRAGRAALSALRRLRRLRPAALGARALPGLEGRAGAPGPGPRADRDARSCHPSRLRRTHAAASPCMHAPLARRSRLGFKARRSWRLVEIGVCPIAHPALEAALPALAALAKPFLEHPKSAPTLHVTRTETGLDVDVTGIERRSGGLSADARVRAAERAAAGDFARVTLAGEIIYQARQPLVRLGRALVALPPGGFLQAVPEAEAAMGDFAATALAGAGRVADLFCGVGTFSFRLAETASVQAIDVSAASIKALVAASGSAQRTEGHHRRGARPGAPADARRRDEAAGRGAVRSAPRRRGRTGARDRRFARADRASASPAIPPPSPATPASWSMAASPFAGSCRSTSSSGRRTWSWWACSPADAAAPIATPASMMDTGRLTSLEQAEEGEEPGRCRHTIWSSSAAASAARRWPR